MLNHGMSGHVNTSCDMDVFTPAGIHFGFLQAWSQVCSWAYWRHPWLLGEKLLPIFKTYARLRYRLMPYIYSTAHVAVRSGMPIMRAMPLVFPNDPRCDDLVNQYMLGDAFLTAAFAEDIYLPEGHWIDFWTGKEIVGPQDITCTPPEGRGGPLYVRAGAIVPTWPDVDYVGQKPLDTLGLHIYPPAEGEPQSTFTLCEDDGETFAYLDGEVARTVVACERTESGIVVTIQPRHGDYDGMPGERSYEVYVHIATPPANVLVDDRPLPQGEEAPSWRYDEDARAVHLVVAEDTRRQRPVIVRCEVLCV
jgi:alpha-glucosidase (family GH31 glycosyl hydrolase)